MNIPPTAGIAVPAATLRDFATRLATAAGLPADKVALLAGLLTDNDRRGVVSHGTQQLATYVRLLRDGVLNADPHPSVTRETANSLVLDGDGGLGYFPAYEGTKRLLAKLADADMGVLLTRNHGHFGAAGLYARMTLGHDVICFVTSGHQLKLVPGASVFEAAGGSPMCFTAPTSSEDPVVLDFGAVHDLYADSPHRDALVANAPGLVHRSIGLGVICQAWGGLLAGVPLDEADARRDFAGANQGSMVVAIKIALFADPVAYRREMDAYVRAVRELTPLVPGTQTFLPGGLEAAREREYDAKGIPVGERHQQLLEQTADLVGVEVPWERLTPR